LENRQVIWEEINNSSENLKRYLVTESRNLLKNPNIFEWIDCNVERGLPPASYFILEAIKKFTA
jgi:hypothetical protein